MWFPICLLVVIVVFSLRVDAALLCNLERDDAVPMQMMKDLVVNYTSEKAKMIAAPLFFCHESLSLSTPQFIALFTQQYVFEA